MQEALLRMLRLVHDIAKRQSMSAQQCDAGHMASAAVALSRASTFANNQLCRVLHLVADVGHCTILVEALLTKADGA